MTKNSFILYSSLLCFLGDFHCSIARSIALRSGFEGELEGHANLEKRLVVATFAEENDTGRKGTPLHVVDGHARGGHHEARHFEAVQVRVRPVGAHVPYEGGDKVRVVLLHGGGGSYEGWQQAYIGALLRKVGRWICVKWTLLSRLRIDI